MKKIPNTIILPGQQEQVFNLEADDSVFNSAAITKTLLVVLLAKNFSDLVVMFVNFLKNLN